ncbi:MAG TPA: tRNA (adenosine(37)-N6)-dimethylallyltransferase MiaA, partial [Bacteroidales bacterium]|nr:tRNA (adenosine(37)-N6)-dimethylallyltransferase MiaA [Bacteroidales bacterium]
VKTETLLYYGLEYKYITLYLMNKLSYEEMFEQLEIAIHQFAKRQMTWFRGMERRGTKINWIDGALPMEEKVKVVLEMMI